MSKKQMVSKIQLIRSFYQFVSNYLKNNLIQMDDINWCIWLRVSKFFNSKYFNSKYRPNSKFHQKISSVYVYVADSFYQSAQNRILIPIDLSICINLSTFWLRFSPLIKIHLFKMVFPIQIKQLTKSFIYQRFFNFSIKFEQYWTLFNIL